MIEKIKKQLEKIYDKKEKIKFLMTKIKETKDKKLIIQIEILLNEIIETESLEERIQIPQQQIDVPKRELEKAESLQQGVPEETKKEDFFERINYVRGINYDSERERLIRELSVSPLRRDSISNLNLSAAEIRNYFNTERQEYIRKDEANVKSIRVSEIERTSFEIPEILKRRKLRTEDIKYELT